MTESLSLTDILILILILLVLFALLLGDIGTNKNNGDIIVTFFVFIISLNIYRFLPGNYVIPPLGIVLSCMIGMHVGFAQMWWENGGDLIFREYRYKYVRWCLPISIVHTCALYLVSEYRFDIRMIFSAIAGSILIYIYAFIATWPRSYRY